MTSELYVYDSQGGALHPPGADDKPEMKSFFNEKVAAVTANPPTIQIYGKVKTEKRREQVSFTFVGERYETLFRDFANAIRQQLVEERGWDLPTIQDGPAKFFKKLFSDLPNVDCSPDLNHYFDFDEESFNYVELLAKDNDAEHTPHIKARSYEAIAEVLPHVVNQWADPVTVSRPRYVAPDFANFHFTVSETQRQKFTIADTTRGAIERLKEQQMEQRKREKLDSLPSIISELNTLGASPLEIKQKLNTSLDPAYPNLSVYTQQKISKFKARSPGSTSSRKPSRVKMSALFVLGLFIGGAITGSYLTKRPTFWWEFSTLIKGVSVIVTIGIVGLAVVLYFYDISLSRQPPSGRTRPRRLLSGRTRALLSFIVIIFLIAGIAGAIFGLPFIGGDSEGPTFELSDLYHASETQSGESLTVSVHVSNSGESGSGTIIVGFNRSESDQQKNTLLGKSSKEIQLDQSEEDTIEFEVEAPQDEGKYNLIVKTSADEISGTVNVTAGQ